LLIELLAICVSPPPVPKLIVAVCVTEPLTPTALTILTPIFLAPFGRIATPALDVKTPVEVLNVQFALPTFPVLLKELLKEKD